MFPNNGNEQWEVQNPDKLPMEIKHSSSTATFLADKVKFTTSRVSGMYVVSGDA